MRTLVFCFLLLAACSVPLAAQPGLLAPPPQPCQPVNANATVEARALLRTLCAASGKVLLSGQHNYPNHRSQHSETVAQAAGKYPLIWGSDFGFTGGDDKDSIDARQAIIDEAKRQHAAGSIITLMWHAVRPMDNEPVQPGAGWKGSIQAELTNDEWAALTTPGTELNRRWIAQLDVVAGFLRQLQDARIPVLWRPYHEMNGEWFWWGGRPGPGGYQAFYRMTFERLVHFHRLDNLVWVWNANAPDGPKVGPYSAFYPGHEWVDILATDIYRGYAQSHHDDLVKLAAGKPVALGEIGKPPTPEELSAQPAWTWFMGWSNIFNRDFNDNHRALFANPKVRWRGDSLP